MIPGSVERWSQSEANKEGNTQAFLIEFCDFSTDADTRVPFEDSVAFT